MTNNSAAAYEENLIGPSYDYASFIRSPDELGVSSSGSISQIKKNYVAMGEYFKLILSGKSRASKEGSQFNINNSGDGRVLGPSFFVDLKFFICCYCTTKSYIRKRKPLDFISINFSTKSLMLYVVFIVNGLLEETTINNSFGLSSFSTCIE